MLNVKYDAGNQYVLFLDGVGRDMYMQIAELKEITTSEEYIVRTSISKPFFALHKSQILIQCKTYEEIDKMYENYRTIKRSYEKAEHEMTSYKENWEKLA